MTSPWSDPYSIWNSNSPNLNLLRRYSLRASQAATSGSATTAGHSSTPTTTSTSNQLVINQQTANLLLGASSPVGVGPSASSSRANLGGRLAPLNSNHNLASQIGRDSGTRSSCLWEPSSDDKYSIGYIVINRPDLEIYPSALGMQVRGGKPTADGHYGARVEQVVPGSVMNLICKIKVGDEIVEWNGFDLRGKSKEEVSQIMDSIKPIHCIRMVVVRPKIGAS